jgi:hypothetical protein
MKKLVMSAAILATLAAPAFANSYHGTWNQPASPEAMAPRTQTYAPGGFGYSARAYAPGGFFYTAQAYAPGPYSGDNDHASMLSPSSPDYVPDYNH